VLVLCQFCLGSLQAGISPISAGVFECWFPRRSWPRVQGLQTMGLSLGAAATPPLVVSLLLHFHWASSLLLASLPMLIVALVWAYFARNTPREHPAVSRAELAELQDNPAREPGRGLGISQLLRALWVRDVILLSLSYLCMNYTFYLLGNWVFLYLMQQRHLPMSQSGWLASAPPLAAAVGAGLGGFVVAAACRRYGERWGFRLVPLVALPTAGGALLWATAAAQPLQAVLLLTFAFLCIELTEAAFWAAAMQVGGRDTMAVTGFMNSWGIVGGLIGIPIVAYLSGHAAWNSAFYLGAALGTAAALFWLGIDASLPAEARPTANALQHNGGSAASVTSGGYRAG